MLISLGTGEPRGTHTVYDTEVQAGDVDSPGVCGRFLEGNKKRKIILDMANEKRILSTHREAGFGHFTHGSFRAPGVLSRDERVETPPDERGNPLTFP